MTLREKQEVFTRLVGALIQEVWDLGYTCTLGEVYRTLEQANWNTEHGIGIKNSLHCKRLAVDINLFRDGEYLGTTESYRGLGEWWERQHPFARWGGRFKDGNHFELGDL